jgi:chromosome segregation ATPase
LCKSRCVKLRLQAVKIENHTLSQGTDSELKRTIEQFYSSAANKENQLKDVETEMRELNTRIKTCTFKKSQISSQIGALENEQKNYLLDCDRFKSKLNILTKKVNYTDHDCTRPVKVNDSLVKPFIRYLDQYVDDYENETNQINYMEKKAVSHIETQLNVLRDKNSKVEQSITLKTEFVEKNAKEIGQLNRALREFDGVLSIENLNKIEDKIKVHESELETFKRDVDAKSFKFEIENLSDNKVAMKKKLDKLNMELDEMHKHTAVQTQIDMLKNDRKARVNNIERIKREHETDFSEFFGMSLSRIQDSQLKKKYDEVLKNLQSSINAIQVKNKELNREVNIKESKLASLNDELYIKEKQFMEYEVKLQKLGICFTAKKCLKTVQANNRAS